MPPWNTQPTQYCQQMAGYSGGWTSDNVFCLGGAVTFWQTCLYIGLALWGFFTVIQLFSAFDIQHAQGQALGRTVSHLVRQVILLLVACASFFLLMLVHQLVYLICNSLVGGDLPTWRVDDLWLGDGGQNVLMALRIQLDAPYANNPLLNLCNILSGGNCGFGQPQIGGNTFFQIAQGIGFLLNMMLVSTGAIRFVIMLVLLGAAPLAIITAGFSHLRERVFRLWLTKWLELEGLAIVAALGLAAFQGVLCGGASAATCTQYTQVNIVIGGSHPIPVTPGKTLLIPDTDKTIFQGGFSATIHGIGVKVNAALILPAGMISIQIPEDVTTLTTVDLGQSKIAKNPKFVLTWGVLGKNFSLTVGIPVTAPEQLVSAIESAAGNVPFIGIPLKRTIDAILSTIQFAVNIGGDIITATLGALGAIQIQAPSPPPSFGQNNQTQFIFLLLGFAVIICGLQIGYVWNLIGSFLALGTNMYQADYNRDVATIKAIANVVGMVGKAIGDALSVVGMATGQPELMLGGQIISSVSDAPNELMSAIPQANGYGGNTMTTLPSSSNNGLLSAASAVAGDSSAGGGGSDGGSPAPVAGYIAPAGTPSGSSTAAKQPQASNHWLDSYQPRGGQTGYGPPNQATPYVQWGSASFTSHLVPYVNPGPTYPRGPNQDLNGPISQSDTPAGGE